MEEASLFGADGINYLFISNSSNYSDSYDQYEHNNVPISILRIVMSSLSILGAASIIVSALIAGQINNAEVHPIFMLSVADFILAICWMLGGVLWLQNDAKHYFGFCYFLAIITVIAEMVTFLLTLIYAITALLRVIEIYFNEGAFLPDQDKRKKPRHAFSILAYFIAWCFPVITVIPTVLVAPHVLTLKGTDNDNATGCQISFTNVRPYIPPGHDLTSEADRFSEILAGFVLATFVICTVLMIPSYILTLHYVRMIFKLQGNANPETDKHKVKRIGTRVLVYILIFFFSALPSFVAAIIVLNERQSLQLNENSDYDVVYWQAVAAPLQGALNAVVYGWSRKSFRRSFQILTQQRHYGATHAIGTGNITESSLTT